MEVSDIEFDVIERWKDIAIDAVSRFHDEWEENQNYYLGVQWDSALTDDLPIWRSTPVVNLIYPIVEQAHALLTDQRPIAHVFRQAGGTARVERILTAIIEQVWKSENIEDTVAHVQKDRLITGTGFYKTTWNAKDKKRKVPIDVKRVNPEDLFFDPLAEEVEEARYIFERDEMPLAEILEMYPDRYTDILHSEHRELDELRDNEDNTFYDVPKAVVWECYFKDSTLIEEFETTEDGGEKIKKSMRKYPNGRYLKFIGDVILEDKKNPYPWFPYTKSVLVKVRSEMLGLSIITPLKIVQDEINELEANILDNIKSNVFPMFIASEGAVSLEEFVNAPNTVIELRGGIDSKLDRLPGIQLPSEVFQMGQKKVEDLFRLSGVNDVTFGNVVGSSRPGAVKQNFEASITRIREYTRLMNRALSDIGEKIIDLLQMFLPTNTIISINSPDDDVSEMFSPEGEAAILKAMQRQSVLDEIRFRDVAINQTSDEFSTRFAELTGEQGITEEAARDLLLADGIEEFKNDIREGRYKYRVGIHPIQPHDKETMFNQVIELLKYGEGQIVDAEAVFDLLDLPGKHETINRLRRRKLADQQAAAAQNQQPPATGGGNNG